MPNPVISTNAQKLIVWLDSNMMDGNLTNDDLVQFIEALGKYLGLQTIADYAKTHNLSYNGVKNHRKTRKILNVKFVIDNE